MIVEDEESIRSLVTRVLEGLGYSVSSASAAGEALELMETTDQSVDLLLTDVILPGRTQGNDLTEILTSHRPDLPVLFMSGYTRNAMVKAGRLEDEASYLEKPFTPHQLASRVREILDASEDRPHSTPASPAL